MATHPWPPMFKTSRPCDQCGSTVGVVHIPDPECHGVHAWNACEVCRGDVPLTNLRLLEALVESACQAIYAERRGYWPNEVERHHIAIALINTSLIGREGAQDER